MGLSERLLHLRELSVLGKRVLVRVDFNVPIRDGQVTDTTRIEAHLPTIRYLLEREARVVLMSHLGRPDGKPNPKYSLAPIAETLQTLLGEPYEVIFSEDCLGEANADMAKNLRTHQLMLLENLRFYGEEEKNDHDFSVQLAAMGDLYVNDAFGTAHRAHASTVGVAEVFQKAERAAGLLLEKEIAALAPVVENPGRPFAAILGGAKVSDKIKIIEVFLRQANVLMIGGAMAYTFLKAKGVNVGKSLVENSQLELATRLLDSARTRGVELLLPEDHVIAESREHPETARTTQDALIPEGWAGMDIGPKTLQRYTQALARANFIVWNGPMGIFEQKAFSKGTLGLAQAVAARSRDGGATTIAGGGDSVAAINQAHVAQDFTHVSTGGGATLEFFEGHLLPGIEPLLR